MRTPTIIAALLLATYATACTGNTTDLGTMPEKVGAADGSVGADSGPPLDLFFMLDQSASMATILSDGQSRWQHVTAALPLYLMSGLPQGSRAGLQLFGLGSQAGCTPLADGGPPDWSQCASCNVAQYDAAEVAIEPVATATSDIVSAIHSHTPSTFTPTAPAMEGGLQFASTWAAAHADHRTVFVLVTDGFPTQCAVEDIQGLAQLAASAAQGNPSVPTVVVGLGDADANLNPIAVAGGSSSAVLVPDGESDVTSAIVNGLSQRIGALPR